MLSLDDQKIVSFKKGCYPGQEVVARTHYRGRIKRHLVQYSSTAELEPGTSLSVIEADSVKPVGKTLQSLQLPDGSWQGLAVVHESGIAAKALLSATEPAIEVSIKSA